MQTTHSADGLLVFTMLVVATSGSGFVLESDTSADAMMVTAFANSLNQLPQSFDRENGAKMKQTSLKPLSSCCISVQHAAI
ncbi:hypothetical protein DsansV1_C29g0211471 [Dioscorea sansibarensis]